MHESEACCDLIMRLEREELAGIRNVCAIRTIIFWSFVSRFKSSSEKIR